MNIDKEGTETIEQIIFKYKPFFYKYFIVFFLIISYIWYSSSSYSNDRIIEHLILLTIIFIYLYYNGLIIDPRQQTYLDLQNKDKFIKRLSSLYEEYAPIVRNDKFFYINKDNILNNKEWKLFYVIHFDNTIELFQNIEYVRFYNNYIYIKILHFTELFLYYYYYSISKKSDDECKGTYKNLYLLKKEIINLFGELEVDLPTYDKNKKDIDLSLFRAKRQLEYILDSKLFLLSKYSDNLREYDLILDKEEPYNIDEY